jgi:hypothetical protein
MCKHILTGEEQEKHLKDGLGFCNSCRDKRHAETLKERLEEELTKGE